MSVLFSVSAYGLKAWKRVHAFYMRLQEDKKLLYTTIAGVVALFLLLIVFRPMPSARIDYNPFELFELKPEEVTKAKVQSAFRKLSRVHHPDLFPGDEAKRIFYIKLQKAKEILLDDTQRENYIKYGDPSGPIGADSYESYPDWIMRPGKPLLFFYGVATLILVLLPISFMFVQPATITPPSIFISTLESELDAADDLLVNEKFNQANESFDAVERKWRDLSTTFEDYQKSAIHSIFGFRVYARKVQIALYDKQDFRAAIELLKEFKRKYKYAEFKTVRVDTVVKPLVSDILEAFKSLGTITKVQNYEINEALALVTNQNINIANAKK